MIPVILSRRTLNGDKLNEDRRKCANGIRKKILGKG